MTFVRGVGLHKSELADGQVLASLAEGVRRRLGELDNVCQSIGIEGALCDKSAIVIVHGDVGPGSIPHLTGCFKVLPVFARPFCRSISRRRPG